MAATGLSRRRIVISRVVITSAAICAPQKTLYYAPLNSDKGIDMASIQILVGSVTGTAEAVAETVAAKLQQLDHQVSVKLQADVAHILDNPQDILLVCTSNTGSGDLPDNILPLYLQLTRDYPAISGRRYGVIDLGDSSYSTVNEGGQALDAAFADLGAQRIGDPLVLDASEGPDTDEEAINWINEWVKLLR